MTPEQVIEAITESGLRGRGGAGFPHRPEVVARPAPSRRRQVRDLQRRRGRPGRVHGPAGAGGDPHRVLEGLAIAAYAVGAREGYLYVRAEYPLAVRARPRGHRAGDGARLPRRRHPGHCLQPAARGPRGRRRVRLRRGDGADRLARGPARHAAAAPAVSRRRGACAASRPASTTSRRWRCVPGSSATAPRRSPRWAPTAARAPRSSRWPARSTAAG